MKHLERWAAIPVRAIVGFGFMAHGYAKVVRGPDYFVGILHALGVPAPHLLGWLTILVELVGGLAVLLGAFVPLVSVPMGTILLVAVFTVHLPYGSVRSNFYRWPMAGPNLVSPAMRPIFFIWPAWPHSSSADRGRLRSTG